MQLIQVFLILTPFLKYSTINQVDKYHRKHTLTGKKDDKLDQQTSWCLKKLVAKVWLYGVISVDELSYFVYIGIKFNVPECRIVNTSAN